MNSQQPQFYRPSVPASPTSERRFSATITKDRFFTPQNLRHIIERRNALIGRLDDGQIATLIAGERNGWAPTAVEFQIRRMLEASRILPNPVPEPAWDLPSI